MSSKTPAASSRPVFYVATLQQGCSETSVSEQLPFKNAFLHGFSPLWPEKMQTVREPMGFPNKSSCPGDEITEHVINPSIILLKSTILKY